MTIDTTILDTLSRLELQKLAKSYQIKANLKTEIIIKLLLKRHAEQNDVPRIGTPSPQIDEILSREYENIAAKRPHAIGPLSQDTTGDELPNIGTDFDVPLTHPSFSPLQGRSCHESRLPSFNSAYTFATPDSSTVGTPEPEASSELLKNTVEIMAEVTKIDQLTVEKIRKLRLAAAMLRGKAADLRDIFKAEQARRKRLEEFAAHWMKTNPRWTYDEVWSGEMRVRDMYTGREVTTSDEEELLYENGVEVPKNNSPTLLGSVATLSSRPSAPSANTRQSSMGKDNATTPSTHPTTSTITSALHKKRPRATEEADEADEADVESEDRYRPRRRSEAHESNSDQAPLPFPRGIHKGKGKMSPEAVEEMQREKQREQVLQRRADGLPRDAHELAIVLGLTPEDLEQDAHLRHLLLTQTSG